ncbi:hypothetical protein Q4561_12100 [Alteromonas sp. 1_MG-2023]|uniref:hypothetical protein n=1 Tax=Alteromonas sp. 1_MG-2023 TaxID=3062669 RepID=UPI0026E233F1|nr:hypothetical protein [Alteromonas sp. 1_MG-2023]MDO6567804.1 hypothetical protein [Alteromonas sp. 1_MG-2023]
MTSITPIIEFDYVPERAQVFHAKRRGKLAQGLLISAIIHIFGLIIVIAFTTFESGITPVQKPAPISATLYFPTVSVKQPIDEAPEPVEITPPVIEPKIPESPPTQVIEKVADEAVKSTEQIKTVKPKPAETKPTEAQPTEAKPIEPVPIEAVPKEAQQEKSAPEVPAPTPSNVQTTIDSSARNQQAGSLNLSPRAGASQFFNQREQEVIAEEGLKSAREHRRKKESPDLVDTRKGKEDRSYEERPRVKVNCSSNTNKVLTFLSGRTGGTLECSKGSDYDRFIEDRIAKEPEKD